VVENDIPVGEKFRQLRLSIHGIAKPGHPLIVAHRGASALAPENTVAAFAKAIDDEADGIEFDVRRAADRMPVVFHDETLERIAGREARVSDLTSTELSHVDAGTWFNREFPRAANPAFSSERIPTLSQTLQFLEGFSGRIYIELKCDEDDVGQLVHAVAAVLRDSRLLPQIIIKSFTLSALPQIRELLPNVRTAALFEPTVMTVLRKKRFIIDLAEEFGADELSLHYSLVSRGLMKQAGEKAMPVTAWTVDKPGRARCLAERGVFAIITNDPGKLLEAI
jgi:glycerophosphoryl diester phosphodiesterase